MRNVTHVFIMAVSSPLAYSKNGEYVAYASPDGTLKLWETSTGRLCQEYTPSSHLATTCTCLSWGPCRTNQVQKKKKKRHSETPNAIQNLELIALGTTTGTLLLYSLVRGDLHSQLTDGHSESVNSVSWQQDGMILYSCSSDHYVAQWCMSTLTVKHKWKADKNPVYSVSLCHTQKHLLTASRTIKLWDLDKYEVIKKFAGHSTEVMQLIPVAWPSASQKDLTSIENTYFLSASVGERLICAWQVNSETKDKTALASFSLPSEVMHFIISQPKQDGQPFLLVVVTKGGELNIFEHQLNGRCKTPLKSRTCLMLSTEEKTPRPIPILAGHVLNVSHRTVLFAHGSFLKLTMESVPYDGLDEGTVCLLRSGPSKSFVQTETSVSKVKAPSVSNAVTVLAPGNMAPNVPSRSEDSTSKVKRKRRKSLDMTMEERLNAIGMERPAGAEKLTRQPPKADTMATLLAQGLQSHDKKILNHVLQHSNETMIRNTVRRLPMPVIVPLVQELSVRMHGHAQSGSNLVKWIKAVLTLHTSYLMTYPELVNSFSGLYQMMESRVSLFGRLSRLQGKLDLMLSQITSQTQEEDEASVATQHAMLLYQDDSSDDDTSMGDIIPDVSESEDNWDEPSEDEAPKNGDRRRRDSDSDDSIDEDMDNLDDVSKSSSMEDG